MKKRTGSATKTRKLEESKEPKDEKEKYYNDVYTFQKLRSLKWMGGVYKNKDEETTPVWKPSAEEKELME